MPVVGAVLVLSPEPLESARALATLGRDARLELGERVGDRLPVVGLTPDAESDQRLWRELLDLPGVLFADIVFASLEEDAPAGPLPDAAEPSHAEKAES